MRAVPAPVPGHRLTWKVSGGTRSTVGSRVRAARPAGVQIPDLPLMDGEAAMEVASGSNPDEAGDRQRVGSSAIRS